MERRVARLVKIAADKVMEKQNLKVVVGVECTIGKPREYEEDETKRTPIPCPSLCVARML